MRSAAWEMQQAHMRRRLQACLSAWAAHAEDMQERRRAAIAHGRTVAKVHKHVYMQSVFEVGCCPLLASLHSLELATQKHGSWASPTASDEHGTRFCAALRLRG